MDHRELRERTKLFALQIIEFVARLPADHVSRVLGRQILKSGTSIGANYREALRASSRKHFLSIMQIVLREADETLFWLEILAESPVVELDPPADLIVEGNELVAIFTATVKTTKRRSQ